MNKGKTAVLFCLLLRIPDIKDQMRGWGRVTRKVKI